MRDLALRLAALDPEASAALRVIGQFDRLSGGRAGLPTIVRQAALLANCPARLVDADRSLTVRAKPDGALGRPVGPVDQSWPSVSLPGHSGARIWLERPGPANSVEAMVLERAAVTAASALRDSSPTPERADPAWADLLVDAAARESDRLLAARQLGLSPNELARAVAVPGALPRVEKVPAVRPPSYGTRRAGVGPTVPVLGLPRSWAGARTALRFTAEGTAVDPGPRIVLYEELGGLALLAAVPDDDVQRVPDLASVEAVSALAPWALVTLAAVAEQSSLRAAARTLRIHHSTMRERLVTVERHLGWSVRDSPGRLRLYLALALRRLRQSAQPSGITLATVIDLLSPPEAG